MTRLVSLATRLALVSLVTAPALAQEPQFGIEPEPGRVYKAMDLNPPGVTGRIYNDGTTEAAAPVVEAR